jgi:hypothetical protein
MSSQARKAPAPRIGLAVIAALLLIAVGVAAAGIRDARRYPNLRVEAQPFDLPRGCTERDLPSAEWIPKRCAAPRYRLRNATELGLITTGRNTRWYRIADDAVLMVCARIGKYCEVRERIYGKFVGFGYYRDLALKKKGLPVR